MKPYYDQGGITIYLGDSEEVVPGLVSEVEPCFDLLLTDPPYGIGGIWQGGSSNGWGKARSAMDERNEWDQSVPPPWMLDLLRTITNDQVIWGGNYFANCLPPSRGWLVWNKPERDFSLSEAELAWTSRDAVLRVKDLPRSEYGRQHQTQKPLRLMEWCLSLFPEAKTVIDPYMGSGTTLVAAKAMGRRAVGIERNERYIVEMAIPRLAQEVFPFAALSEEGAPDQDEKAEQMWGPRQ